MIVIVCKLNRRYVSNCIFKASTNHINLTFFEIDEIGEKISLTIDNENPLYG